MIIRMHKGGGGGGGAYGHSFKGLGAYLLHDKQADTSERVAWTETRNLATNNPETGMRVMAATAMDADRLKEEAGVRKTGRKRGGDVLHFALSWDTDQAPTREEMSHAVDAILFQLGGDTRKKVKNPKNGRVQYANEHQAVIVAHTDGENPHVHIAVNRVHPQHGRSLPDGYDFLKASKFGLQFEKNEGKLRCVNRAINWEARDRGEFARDTKSLPRNIYDQIKEAGLDPSAVRDGRGEGGSGDQRGKDADLSKKTRELKKRHALEMSQLAQSYREEVADLEVAGKRQAAIAKQKVRDQFRPKWEYRFHEKAAERARFEIDEGKFLGKVKNFANSVDFKELFQGENRKKALQQTFDALASSGGREQALKRQQNQKDQQLYKAQQTTEDKATLPHFEKLEEDKAKSRDMFLAKRSDLITSQRMDRAANAAKWDTRAEQRQDAYSSQVKTLDDGGLTQEEIEALEATARLDDFDRSQDQEQDQDIER